MSKYYVYHICRPNMSLDEGYIGITNDPDRRMKEHSKSDTHVGNALRKYEDIKMKVILECTESYALEIEEKLRPKERIGWNVVAGGGMPPPFKGKEHTAEAKEVISEKMKGNTNCLGNTLSDKHKDNISKGLKGHIKRPANIYDYKTNELLASHVSIASFCREHNLIDSNLARTAKGTRKQHKGFYARYI